VGRPGASLCDTGEPYCNSFFGPFCPSYEFLESRAPEMESQAPGSVTIQRIFRVLPMQGGAVSSAARATEVVA